MIINKKKLKNENTKSKLITYLHPDSIISEQYRTILTNIKFAMPEKQSCAFVITSPGKGEGKSTSAANLAVSMAQQKKKVLLIDGNLRDPMLHTILNIPNTTGLTDVLTGRVTLEEARFRTEIGRLEVLTSGTIPYNPVELLGSQLLKDLLHRALQLYDIVLIDSPSVSEVTDTKLLANQSNGVIVVINRSKTKIKKAIEMKKELEFAKAKFIGVILHD
ncbi:CpsD/CapB family tyrosine-protein kinase [Falsibacillus pallidus]|uniref:non-specific protein-tyrosine kinase n=1 Tax=Falsibacillus pallidus TaxID=493781 RepID=A0A370GPQ7_9BACI|nr:CpsD/CapB family tyrosine-protein kinase [Falsibacillus pallidus]RDI45702.1 capsular exopolysaccharide synthesis family protein [Falsibacillus pallidus]